MSRTGLFALIVWQVGSIATVIKLTFFDGYIYTWWNWLIVVPINLFLGEVWPIYWAVLRPLMGGGH